MWRTETIVHDDIMDDKERCWLFSFFCPRLMRRWFVCAKSALMENNRSAPINSSFLFFHLFPESHFGSAEWRGWRGVHERVPDPTGEARLWLSFVLGVRNIIIESYFRGGHLMTDNLRLFMLFQVSSAFVGISRSRNLIYQLRLGLLSFWRQMMISIKLHKKSANRKTWSILTVNFLINSYSLVLCFSHRSS